MFLLLQFKPDHSPGLEPTMKSDKTDSLSVTCRVICESAKHFKEHAQVKVKHMLFNTILGNCEVQPAVMVKHNCSLGTCIPIYKSKWVTSFLNLAPLGDVKPKAERCAIARLSGCGCGSSFVSAMLSQMSALYGIWSKGLTLYMAR